MYKINKLWFIIIALTAVACTKNGEEKETPLKLSYNEPAEDWNQALPIGNGRLGAMVFGEPVKEHLQLNEETVWAGSPHNNVNPEEAPYLKKVRELIFQGKYAESHKVANENLKSYQNGMPYQTVGDLYLEFPAHSKYTNYTRELNISNATSKVSYKVDGITYTREVLSSFTEQAIYVELTASEPQSLTFSVAITSPQKHTLKTGKGQLEMRGVTTDHEGIPGKVQFTTLVKPIVEGGEIIEADSALTIKKANKVTLVLTTGTNFKNYKDISGDADEVATNYLNRALKVDFSTAKNNHVNFYKSYFNRVTLDLGETDSINNPTNVRIKDFKHGDDPPVGSLVLPVRQVPSHIKLAARGATRKPARDMER